MPKISEFYGIKIYVNCRGEHPPPHFHVVYGNERALCESYQSAFSKVNCRRAFRNGGRMGALAQRRITASLGFGTRATTVAENPGTSMKKSSAFGNAVAKAQPLQNYSLRITFVDGATFDLDFWPMLDGHSGWLYDPLKDVTQFQQFAVQVGFLIWPTGLDVCPDGLRAWCEQGRIIPESELALILKGAADENRWV